MTLTIPDFCLLVVIPELRLSDLGLVDVTQFRHVPVIVGAV